MKIYPLIAAGLVLSLSACQRAEPPLKLEYPVAKQVEQYDNYHGTQVADPYRWLEDDNAADTQDWVKQQQALAEQYFASIPSREPLRNRIGELWNYARFGAPFKHGERTFFFKNDGLQAQSVLYVSEGAEAPRVLLDPNALSSDGTVALSGVTVSPDGELMAFGVSRSGSDWQEWQIMRVASGEVLDDKIEWVKFNEPVWDASASGLYYARYDEPEADTALQGANYFQKLYFHRLGTAQHEDTLIYHRPDQKEWGFVSTLSDDGNYLILTVWQGTDNRNRLFYKDLANNGPVVELIQQKEAEYNFLGNDGSLFYFKTNLDAPNGRIIAIDTRQPEKPHWREIVAEQADAIDSVKLVGQQLVINYLTDVLSQLRVYDLNGKLIRALEMPGKGRVSGLSAKREDSALYFLFNSYLQPTTVYKYALADGRISSEFSPTVAYNPDDFISEQVFYPGKDGTQIPMIISYKRGLVRDSANPTMLYGYGGFNISITPRYSPAVIAWLELGGVYAVANLRGGSEYGEAWHEAGMQHDKQTVFDDFIAAADYLIAQKYTQPSKLGIYGRSNGGLLIGAALTQRPDLFAAAAPAVGVLDMLRFHRFTIGWAWTSEYGSADNAEDFPVLYAYSPLHNLTPRAYPATMVMTADHDDRVVPAHSFKFTAQLQAVQQSEAPVIARIESKAGHGAGKPTAMRIAEWTDLFSFMLVNMGEGARLQH